jgi:hypothetical protein
MNKTEKTKKTTEYEFFGNPVYDPRKKNRIYIKCKNLSDIQKKIDAFIKVAIRKGAKVIEIRSPVASTRIGFAELYSDAKIDENTLKKNTGIRGFFTRLSENRGERSGEQQ